MVINEELLSYIENERHRGVSDKSIEEALVKDGGWSRRDVEEAFDSVADKPVTPERTKKIVAPKMSDLRFNEGKKEEPTQEPKNRSRQRRQRQQESSSPWKEKKPKRSIFSFLKGKLIVFLIVAFLGMTSVAFAYSLIASFSWGMSEEEIISTAFVNFSNTSSLSYDASFDVTAEAENGDETSFSLELEGRVNNASTVEAFGSELSVNASLEELDSSTGSRLPMNASLDARMIGNDLYVLLKEIPEPFLLFIPLPENQWLHAELTETATEQFGIRPRDIYDDLGNDDFAVDTLELAKETELYTIETLPSEKKEGQSMHVLQLRFHPENIKVFGERFAQMAEERDDISAEVKKNITNSNQSIQDLSTEEIQEMVRQAENTRLVVMIGKEDLYPYSLSLSYAGVPSTDTDADSAVTSALQGRSVELRVEIGFSNYNEPVAIDIPSAVLDVEDVLRAMNRPAGTSTTNGTGTPRTLPL